MGLDWRFVEINDEFVACLPLDLVHRQTKSRIYGVRQGFQVEFFAAERDVVFVWVAGADGKNGHDAAPVGFKRAVGDAFQSIRRLSNADGDVPGRVVQEDVRFLRVFQKVVDPAAIFFVI